MLLERNLGKISSETNERQTRKLASLALDKWLKTPVEERAAKEKEVRMRSVPQSVLVYHKRWLFSEVSSLPPPFKAKKALQSFMAAMESSAAGADNKKKSKQRPKDSLCAICEELMAPVSTVGFEISSTSFA